jgi:flagellar motor switch protein FliG
MKPLEEMSGAERAAALLVAMGPDIAAEIMKHLDDDSIKKISTEIAKIRTLDSTEKEDLIGEFLLDLRRTRKIVQGGENVARDILVAAFGEEKAAGVLKKLTKQNLEKGFDFLKEIDSGVLVSFLSNEQSQTIAVTLAHLPSSKAAEILKLLAPFQAKEVAKRLARMEKTSPEAVIEIARVIRKKYEDLKAPEKAFEVSGGVDALVDILGHLSYDQENRLMQYFDKTMPGISQEIRGRIFTFDNIANLTNQEMRILVDEIGDDYTIARAIKGAGDEIRFKFLRNMSRNRATDILSESEAMGPLRMSDISESRDVIVEVMRRLNERGDIVVRKEREKFVE